MVEEKLLTIRDVSLILGISEKEVIDLAESGKIPAYKVGGVYLRFKREQIEAVRKKLNPAVRKAERMTLSERRESKGSFKDRLGDLLYFNDFYILSILIILLILFIIFRGY